MAKRFSPSVIAQSIFRWFSATSIYTQLVAAVVVILLLFLAVAIIVARSLVEDTPRASLVVMLVTTVAIMSVGIVITILAARQVARPIIRVAQFAQQIEQAQPGGGIPRLDPSQIGGSKEVTALALAVNAMSERLYQSLETLEQNVTARTQDLERRSAQLKLAAEVARDASTIRELDVLLNRAANLICDRFSYYHVGIFLLSHNHDYALLKAATGEAGQKMLIRGHQLKVGEMGMVGYVAASGLPRISLDIDQDVTHFRNPLLPETHSEVALPLKVGNQIIGVLDVQSQQLSAFGQEDVEVLRIMADQLAVAIDNVRLYEEAQESLKQAKILYENLSQEAWEQFTQASPVIGYQYDTTGVKPLQASLGRASRPLPTMPTSAVSMPIKVRDQIIATLDIWPRQHEITDENRDLLAALSDRMGQALESARLFNDTRSSAAREQILNQLISRLSQSPDLDTLLQTTVREIGQIQGVAEAAIHITVPERLASTEAVSHE